MSIAGADGEARTWVGVACPCGAEVPIVAAVLGGQVYRSPKVQRMPLFTRWQLGEVEGILDEGIDCSHCGAAIEREEALVVWVPAPVELRELWARP